MAESAAPRLLAEGHCSQQFFTTKGLRQGQSAKNLT